MSLPRLPFAKALREALEAHVGKPVGLSRFPTVVGELAPPFVVLYPITSGSWQGPPLTDDHDTVSWTWQATCVGARADQAEWMLDRVRAAVLGRTPGGGYTMPLSVPGLRVLTRRFDSDSGPAEEAGSTVSLAERYAFTVTRS